MSLKLLSVLIGGASELPPTPEKAIPYHFNYLEAATRRASKDTGEKVSAE